MATSTTSTSSPRGDAPPKCRYPLDDDSSDTMTLPDGRKLGYAQYGQLTGKPIFWLHGLPGSRTEAAYFHDIGLELGVRMIGTDRPGMGLSTPSPGRTLLDWPKDLECLAEHLGIEEYAVVGASGGGPYLLACAYALAPSKLKCTSIICGMGPPDIGMRGAHWMRRLAFPYGWRFSPVWLLNWFFRLDALGRVDLPDEQRLEMMRSPKFLANVTPSDLPIYQDEDILRMMLRGSREAHKQGFGGIKLDANLWCWPWEFRIEDISEEAKVQLWYGKRDVFVPPVHGLQIAARLGGRAQLRLEDETHTSILFNWKRQAIVDILKEM